MAETQERVIGVTGEGMATASPDICDLLLGLEAQSDEPGRALEAVTAAATAVLAAVKEAGVPEADLQTGGLGVRVRGRPEPEGYVAHYSLTVAGRPVSAAGEVLSVAAGASGRALRVHGIRLGFSDPRPLRREARHRAVEDAREKAEDLAAAAGVRLGAVVRIEDGAGRTSGQPMRAFAASAGPVPVEAGTVGITATVTVNFGIQE